METIHVEKYYTSMEQLIEVFCKESRKLGFNANNKCEFDIWKKELRKKLADITGIDKMEKCELCPQVLEVTEFNEYMREKVLIQTEIGIWMPFYVLVPKGVGFQGKAPCMITPHGHGSGGKYSPAGRTDIESVRRQIEHFNYDYGLKFVKEGYIVFCPDARAFGERREHTGQGDDPEKFINSTCQQLNHMAICLGRTVTGMWTWDLMRLIDYIASRNDCDAERIGCAGLSGGGLQTLWLSAMDDRVKCVVISGYFYGYKDSLLKMSENCSCNYVPYLWKYVDMGDLGALISPRPLLIESGSKDPLNGERGIINVTEQVDITRKAYAIFGADDNLCHYIFDGQHKWDGKETYSFIKKHL